jgi:hypothetical protein
VPFSCYNYFLQISSTALYFACPPLLVASLRTMRVAPTLNPHYDVPISSTSRAPLVVSSPTIHHHRQHHPPTDTPMNITASVRRKGACSACSLAGWGLSTPALFRPAWPRGAATRRRGSATTSGRTTQSSQRYYSLQLRKMSRGGGGILPICRQAK